MLNTDHTSPHNPPQQATIYKLTVACPTHDYHVIYLTMVDDGGEGGGFVEWLISQLSFATGGLVKAEIVVEADLDDLPF